ncbi:Hypothetical protein HVR_LOCUS779 [uncultured virus]|nr:Hypothetical protein HVR_LOCUS779 [uncultured virus]
MDDQLTNITDEQINQNDGNTSRPWYRIWWALVLLIVSLVIGIVGYYYIAKLQLVDSLLNASMILGGMGPVDTLHTDSAKIFASFYAIYCGAIFLVIIAFLIDSVVLSQ